jgi:hypothetical protein
VQRVTAKPVRVLIMNMPQLLLDMVKRIIASCDDMIVVTEPILRLGMYRAAAVANADVVILGNGSPSITLKLLYKRPHLKVFAIAANGRHGSLYELKPRVKHIADISAESLIAAIRSRTGDAFTRIPRQ